jgi:hypothetical protein
MVRTHQPGQAVFRSVLPEDIDWKLFPAFPPSVRLAVVVGQPSEPGPYVIRVKVPSVKLMPDARRWGARGLFRLASSVLRRPSILTNGAGPLLLFFVSLCPR